MLSADAENVTITLTTDQSQNKLDGRRTQPQLSKYAFNKKLINGSEKTKKMLNQLKDTRSSIINQAEVYANRKSIKEALRLSEFDNQR